MLAYLCIQCSICQPYHLFISPITLLMLLFYGLHFLFLFNLKEQQGSSIQGLGDSALKLPSCDIISHSSNVGTPSVASPENSSLIVKDGDNGECVSLILTLPESIVPSSVVQDQKNATSTSIPGPLVDGHRDGISKGCLMVVDVEKESVEMDEDDDEDRPLVLDLGDSGNTPSPARSASRKIVFGFHFMVFHFIMHHVFLFMSSHRNSF